MDSAMMKQMTRETLQKMNMIVGGRRRAYEQRFVSPETCAKVILIYPR